MNTSRQRSQLQPTRTRGKGRRVGFVGQDLLQDHCPTPFHSWCYKNQKESYRSLVGLFFPPHISQLQETETCFLLKPRQPNVEKLHVELLRGQVDQPSSKQRHYKVQIPCTEGESQSACSQRKDCGYFYKALWTSDNESIFRSAK